MSILFLIKRFIKISILIRERIQAKDQEITRLQHSQALASPILPTPSPYSLMK